MIGSEAEAREIFEAVGDRWNIDYDPQACPEGWTFLGSGGTRSVYLSPSGVAYKVCHTYEDEEPNYNDIEHYNFELIRKHVKLPELWRVPDSHKHCFNGRYKRYNYKTFAPEQTVAKITILACEHVKGSPFSWEDSVDDMHKAFDAAGLFDTTRSNAMKGDNGYRYIVDAAETFLSVPELV